MVKFAVPYDGVVGPVPLKLPDDGVNGDRAGRDPVAVSVEGRNRR